LVPLVDPPVVEALRQLVAERARRVPLQYLSGEAVVGGVSVQVGPGVFIPRPETELRLEWGLKLLKGREHPVGLDPWTGACAFALAAASARPDAVVHVVGNAPGALAWALHYAGVGAEAGDTPLALYWSDGTDDTVFAELDGLVHRVL